MIPEQFRKTTLFLKERIPSSVRWAIDGSTSLAIHGVDIIPHDIDILTDREGAYRIQDALKDCSVKPISHSSNGRYDSHFGTFNINGTKVEVMGDLKVFRDGRWSDILNPSTVDVVEINVEGLSVPVVSMKHHGSSGYLEEKYEKGEIPKEEYDKMREDLGK